jgi:hypothetical protein
MKRLVASLALLGVVATGAALRSRDHERPRLPALVDLAPDSVRRLVVEADGRRAELSRDGGGWSSDPGTPPPSAALLAGAERQLLPMLAYRVLDADPADPQYGLAVSGAAVRLEDRHGGRVSIRLGAAGFSGAGFYARQDGDAGRVFLVPRSTMDLLRSLTTGERTSSADPLSNRAGAYQAEQEQAKQAQEVPVYLRQVMDQGGRMPPPGP